MYCIAAGKGRPWAQEENSCGPHRADGPTGDLGKKKKIMPDSWLRIAEHP